MFSSAMRTSLALLACLSLAEGFSTSFRPSTPISLVGRNAKNPDRAHFERDMDEAMDNDWRVFRAKLVAAEKAGGPMWGDKPPVYSFNTYKVPSSFQQQQQQPSEMDLSGVNSADFFAIEDHGKTDDTFRPTPPSIYERNPMPHPQQHLNPFTTNHQGNWHSPNSQQQQQPVDRRLGGNNNNAPYTYRTSSSSSSTNPTRASGPRDPYPSRMQPNTPFNNNVYNNNAPGWQNEPASQNWQDEQPSSPYTSPYPQMPAWAAEQKQHFLERPNLLSCDNGKPGNQQQQQEYRYQDPNIPQNNWQYPSQQQQGSYTYSSNTAAVRSRPPSKKYTFPSKNTEMPFTQNDMFQRNGWIEMDTPVAETKSPFPGTTSNSPPKYYSNNNGILEEDPFVSETMRRQIKAQSDLPCVSPKTKIDKHRWAHEIPGIEKGAVLVATERVNDVFQQTVVLITEHHEINGTYGIVINRPLPGNLNHVCKEPSMTVDASLKRTFRNTTVGYGGPMMPNEFTILHSFGKVTGADKICHGVYMGGSHELMNQVRAGKLADTEAMFVKGHIMWKQGELQNELATGYWYLAAVSPDMILRYAGVELTDEDDHNNLWLDIMTCMGGHFEKVARRFRGKGSEDKGRLMP